MNIEKELLEYLYVKLPAIIKLEMHERTKRVVAELAPGSYLYKNWGEISRGSTDWLQRVARWEASDTMLWLKIETADCSPTKSPRIGVEKPRAGSWSRKGSGCLIPVFFSAISPDLLVYLKSLINKGLVCVPTERSQSMAATFGVAYGRPPSSSLEDDRSSLTKDQVETMTLRDSVNCHVSYDPAVYSGRLSYAVENKINIPKQETNTMQKLVNDMVTANKEALNVAAKLSVGKTANSTLLAALTSKLPWYAKLFGGKKDLMENPLARVASAQLAVALSKHFAPRNEKLAYVADAMLQESMVELITNGEQLQSLITQLEALAGNVTGEIK